MGVEDTIIYLLHRAHSYLDKGKCAVRIMFFDFSSAFNTIQPLRLSDKLLQMDDYLNFCMDIVAPTKTVRCFPNNKPWITSNVKHLRLKDCVSETVLCSTGAPQGTVLSPVLFTLYTSDFTYNSESCHIQKFSDDSAIVGCIRDGQEGEYRNQVDNFVQWCRQNDLQLNTTKTKEMVVDFRRSQPPLLQVSIEGVSVEVVNNYKYLGVHMDNKLDWSANIDAIYKKGQSRLYFLRRLRSFNVCSKLLRMFYQSVVASILFYAVVCWGGSIKKRDAGRLDRLVGKGGAVVGTELDCLTTVAESRTLSRLLTILDNVHHPLHTTLYGQRSIFSGRLLSLSCSTDRLRRSFVPRAIQLYNTTQKARGGGRIYPT